MRLKEPPEPKPRLISTFILHKERYKIDPTYQREAGTWSLSDEQYFIDTILRGLAVPPIFLHKKGETYFIVDGQQRLNTIWKFKENKLKLNEKFSTDIIYDPKNREKNMGKGTYVYSQLHEEWQNRFDNYPLPIIVLEDYTDEEIRDLFRRLQHGKPLLPGEILNAFPGEIVLLMRELASHKFFKEIIPIKKKRYKHYYIVAQLLYLESEGIKDISPRYIYEFFEKNKHLNKESKVYKKIHRVLNFLTETFQTTTAELRKPAWIITVYLLAAHLLENYVMKTQKENFKNFIQTFYQDVKQAPMSGDKELIEFNINMSKGTTSTKSITLRYTLILKRFLEKYNPMRLDENRFFTEEQKIEIFRKYNGKCGLCGKELKFNSPDTHFHHKDRYIEGGKTIVENALLVCKECHLNKIHGKGDGKW